MVKHKTVKELRQMLKGKGYPRLRVRPVHLGSRVLLIGTERAIEPPLSVPKGAGLKKDEDPQVGGGGYSHKALRHFYEKHKRQANLRTKDEQRRDY